LQSRSKIALDIVWRRQITSLIQSTQKQSGKNDVEDINGQGALMYLYWRVQQDLNCLGEVLTFIDPALKRCYTRWMRENASGIALAEDLPLETLFQRSLN
jgi:hypothetical protein